MLLNSMKINLIAVGTKMPQWVNIGVDEYRKRLPKSFELKVVEIPLSMRSKTTDIKKAIINEGKSILKAVGRNDYVIALDVQGKSFSTELLSKKIGKIRDSGQNIALLVGGPDGLSAECVNQADEIISLSGLTFPHTVVRIVIAEQIYRIWSVLNKHPYHRD